MAPCDPLTQQLEPSPACGSTDPTNPDRACITEDLEHYFCGDLAPGARGKTDRAPPVSDGSYAVSNGCEAGYLPVMVDDNSGSGDVVCAGLCAPLRTDNRPSFKVNVLGDANVFGKLPSDPDAVRGHATCAVGVKGSEPGENCRYFWIGPALLGVSDTQPSWDSRGLCFAPQHYMYTNQAGQQGTMPDCTTLPSAAALPANCTYDPSRGYGGSGCPDGIAEEWACHPFSEYPQNKVAQPRVRFRPFYGPATLYRHVLQ
jgi:hypothetical protein